MQENQTEQGAVGSSAGLDGSASFGCECSTWCRAEPQPITDKHHKNCPRYNDIIRVVKITCEGSSLYDSNIKDALASLADGDDYQYEVELRQMLKRDYEALPKFDGF
ncbi:MAG: hypothetical protein WDA20_13945 [Desulfuromonadales bacterium]